MPSKIRQKQNTHPRAANGVENGLAGRNAERESPCKLSTAMPDAVKTPINGEDSRGVLGAQSPRRYPLDGSRNS